MFIINKLISRFEHVGVYSSLGIHRTVFYKYKEITETSQIPPDFPEFWTRDNLDKLATVSSHRM